MAAGRRRTDPPDGLWRGASAEDLSDHPTDPGRARNERAAGGIRTPDGARQLSRSRLPLPPVPMPAPTPSPVPPAVVAAGPRTTMAPFRAVPTPEGPARETPVAAEAPSSPARTSVPSPRLPAAVPAVVPSATGYGDWTKPSRPSDDYVSGPAGRPSDYVSGPVGRPVPPAPLTTMIPERTVSGRRGGSSTAFDEDYADDYAADDYDDYDEPLPVHPSAPLPSAPAVGGRAARRAERQAAEQARLKAAKRNGVPIVDALEAADLADEQFGVRKPRRVAKGLIAMVVVACGVLGAYSYVSPKTSEAASRTPAASPSAAAASDTTALPPLATTPVAPPPATAVAPVRVPVTVLNATSITGLAAKVAAQLTPKGWPSAGVGAYKAGDVAASTVFFTQGDEKQRQAAVQLVDQFPKLTGPAVRFFQLPAGVPASGLVVVLTGDWQP